MTARKEVCQQFRNRQTFAFQFLHTLHGLRCEREINLTFVLIAEIPYQKSLVLYRAKDL